MHIQMLNPHQQRGVEHHEFNLKAHVIGFYAQRFYWGFSGGFFIVTSRTLARMSGRI